MEHSPERTTALAKPNAQRPKSRTRLTDLQPPRGMPQHNLTARNRMRMIAKMPPNTSKR
jgi:hypothetical protein